MGATGNSPDYEPYLKELGAAEERDDIYASMDYCPITDLPHADLAYEWVFNGVDTYYQSPGGTLPQKPQGTAASSGSGDQKDGVSGRPLNAPQESQKGTALTAEQKKVSARLKALFPAYVNSLGLKDADGNPLTLDQKGNGSFKEYIEKTYMEGAQKALDAEPVGIYREGSGDSGGALADPPWGSGPGYRPSCTGNPGSEAAGGRQGRGFCHSMGKRPCRGL
ncbi:MAG: hypothetical protein Q4F92_04765 [Acidaminococcus sp.]|uniref:hypothetical protein n=1 Tax=Acidaminococcus sp. TaxID=1872103 RepID=UPI0026E0F9E9|nr:hypothetical protein [Acidaminococcus sp.]MDO5597643.1 hypothetical protein [Acidaminococcus sp.]